MVDVSRGKIYYKQVSTYMATVLVFLFIKTKYENIEAWSSAHMENYKSNKDVNLGKQIVFSLFVISG